MEWVMNKWSGLLYDDGKDRTIWPEQKHLPHKFRLLDDDGNIYGYGQASENDTEAAFEPLDYYLPRYGCTEIQYYNDGKWEPL